MFYLIKYVFGDQLNLNSKYWPNKDRKYRKNTLFQEIYIYIYSMWKYIIFVMISIQKYNYLMIYNKKKIKPSKKMTFHHNKYGFGDLD